MRRVLPLIAVLSLAFAPAPFPRPARPIEVVYGKIRLGMGERDLDKLMSPFKKQDSSDGQGPCWSDGQFEVSVTVSSSGVREKWLFNRATGWGKGQGRASGGGSGSSKSH